MMEDTGKRQEKCPKKQILEDRLVLLLQMKKKNMRSTFPILASLTVKELTSLLYATTALKAAKTLNHAAIDVKR